MTTAPEPQAEPVVLTAEMKEFINGAYANGTPFIVAYVDESGRPHQAPRGSTQVYSDDQLAIWLRDQQGGLPTALRHNPHMSLYYIDFHKRVVMEFRGRGQVHDDEATRKHVYETAPPNEQAADAERKGTALIIDLDAVEGRNAGVRVSMRRA